MSQSRNPFFQSPWRFWLWLVVWSFLVATVTVYWQVGDRSNWIQDQEGKSSLKGLAGAWLMTFILVLIPSYMIGRAWRNLPRSRMARTWLGIVSVACGILWCSFLMERGVLDWGHYSPANFLTWVLVWSVVFLTGLLFLFSLRHFFRWLCCWRIAKRCLFGAGLLIVLAMTFYAEENWRGKRAWENYRCEWEAKGEKFELSAFAPPAVPDEQNFAMAPIVVSCYAGRMDRPDDDNSKAGTAVPSRLTMELQRTNLFFNADVQIGVWQQAKRTDLAAWQNYYRTRFVTNSLEMERGYPPMPELPENTNTNKPEELVGSVDALEFSIAAQPQSPSADVLLALSRYEAALAELREAAARPASRFPVNYLAENPMRIQLPHLSALKQCATVLQMRAIAELQTGQTDNALADVKLMLRLAEHLRNEPFLGSHLTRLAVISLAVQPIWEGLAAHRWSTAQLQELLQALQPLDFGADLPVCLRGDLAANIGYLEWCRKHPDDASGQLIYAISPRFFDSLEHWGDYCPNLPDPVHNVLYSLERAMTEGFLDDWISRLMNQLPPAGWYELNKVYLAKAYQEQMFQIANPAKHLISRQAADSSLVKMLSEWVDQTYGPYNLLARMLIPPAHRTAREFAIAQNSVDLAKVACALESYRLTHGEFPENLAMLTPEFLPVLPPDVVNGEPLHYRRMLDGRFTLYSVGWNGKDDGGVVEVRNGRYLDLNRGDWVWQYPAD